MILDIGSTWKSPAATFPPNCYQGGFEINLDVPIGTDIALLKKISNLKFNTCWPVEIKRNDLWWKERCEHRHEK